MNKKIYLTIDFENKRFDLARQLGLKKKLESREDILWESYNNINKFLEKSLNTNKITFFCTGNLVQQFPDLIKKICTDGHEIASHYYHHDLVYKEKVSDFEYNIQKSINLIENLINKKVFGFRAPFFSIRENDLDHYNVLSRYFKYDSSLNLDDNKRIVKLEKKLNNKEFKLFPVISSKIYSFLPKIKLGGSYLKLLNVQMMIKLIERSHANRITPIIYLHPYEFINENKMNLSWNELQELGILNQLYWYFNQKKWHNKGNKFVSEKLAHIFKDSIDGSTILDLYKTSFH